MSSSIRLSLVIFLFSIFSFAQETTTIEYSDDGNLVSGEAFKEFINNKFSYLLLGENSPQQGVSTTLKDDGTNIKINGTFLKKGTSIFTLEADLTTTEGIYFFDDDKGSKKARIGINWFRNIHSTSGYYKQDENEKQYIALKIFELITTADSKDRKLIELIKETNLSRDKKNDAKILKKINSLKTRYNISDNATISIDTDKYKKTPTKNIILKRKPKISKTDTIQEIAIDSTNKYNITLLLEDYLKNRESIIDSLEKQIIKLELDQAKDNWGSQRIWFFGLKPYYQRESFRRFQYDETIPFTKMFNDQRGDVYGFESSLNFSFQRSAKGNKYIPHRIFTRLRFGANRTSNVSSFKNSTLGLTTELGNDSEGNPITFTNADSAFIGDKTYEYGVGTSFNFDIYIFPSKDIPIGVFAELGYEYINFSRYKPVSDKEISPLRAGLLFNINNKKDKSVVTLRAFFDRTDLSLSPKGKDKDLKFGFGLGLPFNF